ncbi:MAG TPA: PIN domain-containing protein [Gemmatimonadales bacterium]|nr:PIN domain-containing protein [Gemmatimonadales bacterium]
MIAYLESSVILRLVLGQPAALRELRSFDAGATSALAEVECLRTLDRLRLAEGLGDLQLAERRAAVYEILGRLTIIDVTRPVLERASQPLPVTLGTLDALHLASALAWREHAGEDVVLATHDARLGAAARALGLDTVGN